MKKLFILAFAALSLTLVSCTSVEKKATNYAEEMLEATKDGDLDKLQKVSEETSKWYNGLSDEDKKVADEATQKYVQEHMNEFIDAAVNGSSKAIGDAAEDVQDEVDDAMDELKDALDE